ncbi:uncharacterized protein LOC143281964 isoform X2 [Babylonia areolata]|uniref:uncharacterized protein LOC143281964 isoform X2 n=1 Tax=Babylonia areolata TaxID=304850 RepID=UPI003FCFA773
MTDGNQNITPSTTTTTTTPSVIYPQSLATQPPHPHTMAVGAAETTAPRPQSFHAPLQSLPYQGPLLEQYRPYYTPYLPSHPGYFPSPPHGQPGLSPPLYGTQVNYGLSSPPGLYRPALPTQPPVPLEPESSYPVGGEEQQPQLNPFAQVYVPPHQTSAVPPSPYLVPFPGTDIQYEAPAVGLPGVPADRTPPHSVPGRQHVHMRSHAEQVMGLQKARSDKLRLYLEPAREEQTHPQEQISWRYTEPASEEQTQSHVQIGWRYTEPLPEHQQWHAQRMRHLEVEEEHLLQTQELMKTRMQQIEREKKQLAAQEFQVEQEKLQQRLAHQSLLQQQRMLFAHRPFVSALHYGSPTTTPLSSVLLSEHTVYFSSPDPQSLPLASGLAPSREAKRYPPHTHTHTHTHTGPEYGQSGRGLAGSTFLPVVPVAASGLTEAVGPRRPTKDVATFSTGPQESTPAEPVPVPPSHVADLTPPDNLRRVLQSPRPFPRQRSSKHRLHAHYHQALGPGQGGASHSPNLVLQDDVHRRLRKYALHSLVPVSDPQDDEGSRLEAAKRAVTRVPAVCFNEQKFVEKENYQVLVQPQSPAVRGQEALARVCFALEQALRLRGRGAVIISDYKFRENYLKRAPQDVLEVLHRPEDEGCHNVLMIGPDIGIVCIQIISSALDIAEDLVDLLTLDRLPHVGHRHWLSRESRVKLWEWFDRLAVKCEATLSVENYLQIFARYTCGWSVPEVWSTSKPRVLIRSWVHAVAETYRRYHLPILTPQQDSLLHSSHSYVLIEASTGTGHTCVLKAKVTEELGRGCIVLVFIPQNMTSLRKEYEQLATSEGRYLEKVYFWCGGRGTAGNVRACFKTLSGTAKVLDELTGTRQETFAVFEFANHDDDLLRLVSEETGKLTSVWVMFDSAMNVSKEMMPKEDTYLTVQFSTVTRLPSFIQILMFYRDLEGSTARTMAPRTSTVSVHPTTALQGPDVSSYQGLPTDGPFPVFIWHPVQCTETGILGCHLCIDQFRIAVQTLVPEFFPRTDTDRARDEASPATQTRTARDHIEEMTPKSTVMSSEDSEESEPSIDINSGNVPPPLTACDIVIMTESREEADALRNALDLVNVENVIFTMEDLPQLLGTEKAVVCFVGRVVVQAPDTVLYALVTKLRGVMGLCQGQLILAVELQHDPGLAEAAAHHREDEPFQADIDDMVQGSWKEHNEREGRAKKDDG